MIFLTCGVILFIEDVVLSIRDAVLLNTFACLFVKDVALLNTFARLFVKKVALLMKVAAL